MVSLISRSPLSQYSTRRRFDPASEPNLCDMPWLPDIVVASGRSFQSIDGATDCNEKDSPRLLSQITQSFLSTSQMLRPARQKVEPRVKTQHDERPHTTTDCSQPFSVVGMEFYAPLSHEGTLTKAERHKASTRRLISSALAVTDFSTTNFQPSSSLQSSFLHGGGYMMTERLFPCQGRSVKHPKRSIHEQIHGPPFTTLICATNINDPTNSPHEGVGSSFDSESSFEDQNDSRLCEWAEFLDDVNLDASSTSSDEKQPRP